MISPDDEHHMKTVEAAADGRGAFVQPALYEAFGLTVVEAMTCGLPTFATNCGGPAGDSETYRNICRNMRMILF